MTIISPKLSNEWLRNAFKWCGSSWQAVKDNIITHEALAVLEINYRPQTPEFHCCSTGRRLPLEVEIEPKYAIVDQRCRYRSQCLMSAHL